jgi:zona occludens toxin
MLANDEQFKGRPLFVMGVPDLLLEHSPCPAVEEWTMLKQSPEDASIELPYFTFPENSVVVVDEAQRIYRPRPVGSKVPLEVQAFETHRHTGVDFILLTQHSGLIDSNIRKLIGKHVHIRITPLGRYKYEWSELGDPESPSSRQIAARNKYVLPKRSFDLYKSSQLHTKIKSKIPWFVWMFLICLVSAIGLGWYGYNRVTGKLEPKVDTTTKTSNTKHETVTAKTSDKLSTSDYLAETVPRVAGMYHTAPRYDEVTKPIDAPWPVGCFVSHSKKVDNCRCIDQQGNKYAAPQSMCNQIVDNGIFKDWGEKQHIKREENQKQNPQQVSNQQPQQPQQTQPAPHQSQVTEKVAESNPRPIPQDSPWRFKGA